MFNFLKRKKYSNSSNSSLKLFAPVKGRIMDISQVPDQVFAGCMIGDGVGIEPDEGLIVAPCDGEIAVLPPTLHAVALISNEGVEILIHVGLDTVELGGTGFTAHVKPGNKVRCGEKLLTFDLDYIRSQGKLLTTPIVITNMDEKVSKLMKFVDSGNGVIMEIALKN
ncbi:MAG TPA: PTS glucose transporter subunit IIA [Methylomusa anaerophila]|uniref:PTS system glucose-specific EIICBA component n=1 Tax=Methylomusa anaerophila TaxID=1930071 RepID=A0A348ANI0_9FIRM|nr:PTS glucose transporter subunit IIA [Methylomusa anaerophila]BBB92628.1 PTS system glucose-specific EIICBA component [Methylomusa anaerophila]HML87518.1 PTS glucose transporter subunit IIA [Methylomusa anaerophila]